MTALLAACFPISGEIIIGGIIKIALTISLL